MDPSQTQLKLINTPTPAAFRATIPYLLAQRTATSTWTVCSGAQGDLGTHPAPAMSQGALFSFCTAAARELAGTNVRFNETYLFYRVEVDTEAEAHGVMKASDFARVYEQILKREEIAGSRVRVEGFGDLDEVRFEDLLTLSRDMERRAREMRLAK